MTLILFRLLQLDVWGGGGEIQDGIHMGIVFSCVILSCVFLSSASRLPVKFVNV